MLLINICVLVGAVVTPPSLWWLYSTHIILLCLYHLVKRNWRGLTLVGISLFALSYTQVWSDLFTPTPSRSVEAVWHLQEACYSSKELLDSERIYVIQGKDHFYSMPCSNQHAFAEGQKITLRVADRFGSWGHRYAYSKNAGAFAFIPTIDSSEFRQSHSYFSQFPSWRFSLSLVKGDRSYWTERDKWLVNHFGLTHLFVVSGLHVGFVCFLAICLAKAIWIVELRIGRHFVSRRWHELFLAMPFCVAYTIWSGVGEPAIRATLMAFAFLMIRANFRYCASYLVLALCAWLMLLLWPGRSLDASFWLSFSFVFLLILLVNKSPATGRYVFVQCLLSLFAVLLTWGWQNSISSLTVVANLVMIPFVALVWFPLAFASIIEYQILHNSYLYFGLDRVLVYAYDYIEPYLYWAPEIEIIQPHTVWQKLTLVSIAYFGVLCLPLARGFLLLAGVCIALIWPKEADNVGTIIAANRGQITMLDAQFGSALQGVVVASNQSLASAYEFDAHKVLSEGWRLAIVPAGQKDVFMLKTLTVKTIELAQDERLWVRQINDRYVVRSSSCYRVLNLLKTDGCEHAETLESVLN